jgi:tetratricopeptide (TPR) repeat protein
VEPDSKLTAAIAAFERGDLGRARALAERQLAGGHSPQALHLMGLIECRSGRLTSGIDWLSRALDADPADVAVRVMLARALVDNGRHGEALEVACRPPGHSPAEIALWHVRAESADGVEDWEASVEAWRAVSAARRDDWRGWNNLGRAASALSRWPEAAAALKRAADLNAAEPGLRRALATALARAGRFHESANELGRWVEATPDDLVGRIMLARLLADLGRQQEAEIQLDAAARIAGASGFDGSVDVVLSIARQPSDGQIDLGTVRELAQLLDRTNRTEALSALLDALDVQGIDRLAIGYPAAAAELREGRARQARAILVARPDEPDAVRWHWLMGRICDALGDPVAAFAEADAMHLSHGDLEDWRARGARHLEFVRKLAEVITPEWAAGVQAAPPDERRAPAFLVGFPRSGTTLLDTFLGGHPDAHVLEEVPLILAVERVLGDITELPRRTEAQLRQARDAYFAEAARHVDAGFSGLLVDKLPLNMLAVPYLHAVFPDASFIFAQRHPCDAVLSCFMQDFALNPSTACFLDLDTAAAYYDAVMRVWTQSWEALPLNVYRLVYEGLVADPEAALRPLVGFLGLDWRRELLDHRATAKARADIGSPSYNQVTQPITRSAAGRWRRYEKQMKPVLPVLRRWAERLGYGD